MAADWAGHISVVVGFVQDNVGSRIDGRTVMTVSTSFCNTTGEVAVDWISLRQRIGKPNDVEVISELYLRYWHVQGMPWPQERL